MSKLCRGVCVDFKNIRGIHFRSPLSRELKNDIAFADILPGLWMYYKFPFFTDIYICVRFHLVDFVDTCSKFYTLESEGEYQKCMGWLAKANKRDVSSYIVKKTKRKTETGRNKRSKYFFIRVANSFEFFTLRYYIVRLET